MKKVLFMPVLLMLITGLVMMGCDSGTTTPGPGDGPGSTDAFDDAVGLTVGLEVVNKGTFENGIFTLGKGHQGDSSGIKITLANAIGAGTTTSASGSKKLIVTYVCKLTKPAAKLTVKDDNAWNANDVAYLDLKVGEVATFEIDENKFVAASSVIFLQANDYQNADANFQLKITKVELE